MGELKPQRVVRVRATVEVDVTVPADWNEDQISFYIEENSCPGTSAVGAAIDALIAHGDEYSVCWACPSGANKILDIGAVQQPWRCACGDEHLCPTPNAMLTRPSPLDPRQAEWALCPDCDAGHLCSMEQPKRLVAPA